jgi:uncharacterized protein YqfB (UPF0267 family)
MKKQHNKETKVDLLAPIISNTIVCSEQTDCFRKEWDARASECNICSDEILCGILFSEAVKSKKKAFEVEHFPFLDQCDFKGVDMTKIERLAKKYEEEGEPMTFEELQKLIQDQANTKDVEAIIQFIKRELPLTKIYLTEGVCRVRS